MSTVKANNVQVGQSGTATNNFTLYQPSSPDGTVRLAVGNSGATSADVLTADSSGNVLVGKTSLSDSTVGIQLRTQGVYVVGCTSSGSEALMLNRNTSDGTIASIKRGNTEVGTISVTGSATAYNTASPSADGAQLNYQGITFRATQSASSNANTLDDYEEGTFNAGIAFGGNAVGVTYVSQAGAYVKTGRMVWCSLCIQTSSKGSSTGNFTITGLPFTSSAVNSYFAVASEGLFAMTGASGGAGTANVGFYSEMGGSSTSVTCYFKTAAANAWTNITNADVTNTMNYFLTICYQTST